MTSPTSLKPGPLAGLRVIELGTLLAGPFCGQLLGDFGAEVIKVEPPGQGDPMRVWGREKAHGKSLWWPVVARNKKAITLDLRQADGQALLKDLVSSRTSCSRISGRARWKNGGSAGPSCRRSTRA